MDDLAISLEMMLRKVAASSTRCSVTLSTYRWGFVNAVFPTKWQFKNGKVMIKHWIFWSTPFSDKHNYRMLQTLFSDTVNELEGRRTTCEALVRNVRQETGQSFLHSKEATVTLWLFNIAMENAPFIDGLPIY